MGIMRIYPKFKILISYDLLPNAYDAHYRFFVSDFVPQMQTLGIYMIDIYQVLWGDYPARIAEFVAESLETVYVALQSETFKGLEAQFKTYTATYQRRVITYRAGFQL